MTKEANRFAFWRIFWIVAGIYLFFSIIGIIGSLVAMGNNPRLWERMFSLRKLIEHASAVGFFVLYFYITMNQFYQAILERKSTIHYLRPVVISFGLIGIHLLISWLVLPAGKVEVRVDNTRIRDEDTLAIRLFSFLILSIFLTALSLFLAYITNLRDEKKQRQVLEAQKLQLEIEKSQANFNFLKAQINPHFLHNTLNFLYARSLPYSAELSEGILTLSDIMRYALSEGNAKDGKALLRDEIEHMRNVIKINQLRFSNNLKVNFEVEGVVNGAQIIPFVLITLVENAFKHGELKNAEQPIDIRLQVEGSSLRFYCRNRKKNGPKELSTGIGLDNIRKRLDHAYGENYRFATREDADYYTTELTISQL
jgi:two-component system LytT family sensor kinase